MMKARGESTRRSLLLLGPSAVLVLFLCAGPLLAQTDRAPSAADRTRDGAAPGPEAPEDTEIKLPEMLLEVEEAQLERVQAELPETAQARLGDVGIPLPTETELAISPAAFEVPELEEGDAVTATGSRPVSLYSDAVLGAGSMNHILGSLSLYRLGDAPRFRLQFSHDGRDGYNFEEPGTGYFDRTEDLSGWVETGETTTTRLEAGFVEHERGLQGQPTFFSTKSRFLNGRAEVETPFGDRYRFSARIDTAYAERLRTVADESQAPAGSEIYAEPGARVGIDTTAGTFYADSEYVFRRIDDDGEAVDQGVGLSLGADLLLGRGVSAGAEVGVFWPVEEYVYVPFLLRLTASPAEALTLSVEGGMEPRPLRIAERWRDYPTFATRDLGGGFPGWMEDWYADAQLLIDVADSPVTAEVSGRYSWLRNTPDLGGYDPDAGATSYELEDRMTVTPGASLRWDVAPVGVEVGWSSTLLERAEVDPLHSARLGVELRNEGETLGARADLSGEYFDGLQVPVLDLTGYVDVSEAVRVSLDILDVFAPAIEDGRPRIGGEVTEDFPFIEPGFRVVLKTRVSL
jgi:hypothetical protein